MSNTAQANERWASNIIAYLFRQGVHHCCISPGSRSTPLTLAATAHPQMKTHIHIDERGAAFFALGLSKGLNEPVVMICTSGTAPANYYPAVIEAGMDHVPLIVLSADRPPELHNVGANQSIDQQHLFGNHVRAFLNLDCPKPDFDAEDLFCELDAALHQMYNPSPGPIHINCMLREPFVSGKPFPPSSPILNDRPTVTHVPIKAGKPSVELFKSMVGNASRGVLLVGRMHDWKEIEAASNLIDRLEWPVIADIASGLRGKDSDLMIQHSELLLRAGTIPTPDFILAIGEGFVSKHILQWLDMHKRVPMIQIQSTPECNNPTSRLVTVLRSNLAPLIPTLTAKPSGILAELQKLNRGATELIQNFRQENNELTGLEVCTTVAETLPPGHGLFLGNSLTIREMDMFSSFTGGAPRICANRGASGIDGNLATIAGFASAIQAPVTAIVGDLTALHDLNSLELIAKSPHPITLIIVNNDGGGIFHMLPISNQREHFEELFGTPHGRSFEHAARMFGLDYQSPPSAADLLQCCHVSGIVEVFTNRSETITAYHRLFLLVNDGL